MRAKEFISEQKLDKTQYDSIPDMSSVGVPGLPMGPTNYYHKYRLGVHMAGSPADHHPYDIDGQFVDDMIMVGYSKADQDIIANSIKAFGYKPKKVSSDGSRESVDTGKMSPVAQWNKKK